MGRNVLDHELDRYERLAVKLRRDLVRDARRRNFESACTEGCHWCCCLWVPISMVEALSVARFLLRSNADLSRVHGAVIQQHAHAEQFQSRALYLRPDPVREYDLCRTWMRRKVPCVLLVDGRCSVYSVRPTPCWSHLAQYPEAPTCCLQDLDGLTESVPCYNAEDQVRAAVNEALALDRRLFGRPGLPEPMAVALSAAIKIYGDHFKDTV